MRAEIETFRIAYLTKQLDLSPEEAQVFWPIQHAFTKEMMALHKERFEKRVNADEDMSPPGEDPTDMITDPKKLAAVPEAFIMGKEKELALIKRYHEQFKAILSPEKLGRLYLAHEYFKHELLKKVRGEHPGIQHPHSANDDAHRD